MRIVQLVTCVPADNGDKKKKKKKKKGSRSKKKKSIGGNTEKKKARQVYVVIYSMQLGLSSRTLHIGREPI